MWARTFGHALAGLAGARRGGHEFPGTHLYTVMQAQAAGSMHTASCNSHRCVAVSSRAPRPRPRPLLARARAMASEGIAAAFGLGPRRAVGDALARGASLADDLGLAAGAVGERPALDRAEQERLVDELGLEFADDVPHVRRPGRVIPEGVQHMSSLFQSMAARRRFPAKDGPAQSKFERLAAAWDHMVIRHGDRADTSAGGSAQPGTWTHGNTWTVPGLLRTAFSGVGGRQTRGSGENGVNSTRRGLEAMLSVAGIATKMFSDAFGALRNRMGGAACVVVTRHHDSTPLVLKFGRMEGHLAAHAKYLVLVDEPGGWPQWKAVGFDEFRRQNPHRACNMGVLEVFGQSAVVGLAGTGADDGIRIEVHDAICPPCVLERPTGSCILAATEHGSPGSVEGLKAIALADPEKVVLLSDVPDNCAANMRGKKFIASQMGLPRNMLYDVSSGCCVHRLHRFISTAMGEDKLVGHVHAVQFVLGIHARRRLLERALHELVSRELFVVSGPPPHGTAHNELLAKHTVLRVQKLVRARVGDDSSLRPAARGKALEQSVQHLTSMLNGNWARPCVEHFCCGCCVAAEGATQREAQVHNVVAAILAAGIFGGLGHVVPAKSRWLTTSACLGRLCFGMSVHSILPRVWRLAFGEFSVPQSLGDPDDYHRVVNSKVHRARLWLSQEDVAWKALVVCVCTAPADHLMQRVQLDDASGASMRSLFSPSANPFRECGMAYVDLLLGEGSPAQTIVLAHHAQLSLEVLGAVVDMITAMCLELAGRVWRHMDSFYSGWPYRLLMLASPHVSQAERRSTSQALCSARACCLDDAFSLKVRCWCRGEGKFWLVGPEVSRRLDEKVHPDIPHT